MNNFIFQNPTKLVFGKGQIARLADQLPDNINLMLTFGEGSVTKNGVYDQVKIAARFHERDAAFGENATVTGDVTREILTSCL